MAFEFIRNWARAVAAYVSTESGKIIMIVAIAVVLVTVGGLTITWHGTGIATDVMAPLKIDEPIPVGKFETATKMAAPIKTRLFEQCSEVKGREKHHVTVARFYATRYFSALVMTSVLGLIAAVMLFFISKSGWASADPRLIAIFIVSSAGAAFFTAVPGIFKHDDNLQRNKALYLQYKALENKIISFVATNGDDEEEGSAKKHKDFVVEVDKEMKDLNDLAIGFDATKIPKDFLKETEPRPSSKNDDTSRQPAPGNQDQNKNTRRPNQQINGNSNQAQP